MPYKGDFHFPAELVLKFIAVAFIDDNAVESFTTRPQNDRQQI